MDDGAIGTGARNRIEAGVAKALAGAPELEQAVGGLDLTETALGRFGGKPGEKPADRRAVTYVCRARVGELATVLARFGQRTDIRAANDRGAGRFQARGDPH